MVSDSTRRNNLKKYLIGKILLFIEKNKIKNVQLKYDPFSG